MPLNTSKKAIIEQRRAIIASFRVKGLTQREIVDALPKLTPPIMNVIKGKPTPWSLGIVNSDIKKIEALWKESAQKDISEHKARQLAEIEEVKRQAWGKNEFTIVLKALDQEANIIGTKATIKQELSGGLKLSHEQALDELK